MAYPKGFDLDPKVVKWCRKNANESGGSFSVSHDYKQSLEDSHIVFPRTWTSHECVMKGLKKFGRDNEITLHKRHKDWMLNKADIGRMARNAIIMHVMPVYRDEEATDEVMDCPMSVIIDQAENRLYVQMAILALTMGGRIQF
jgi:ornithine carbamoyltransferase